MEKKELKPVEPREFFGKNEELACPVECGVMAHAFMEECLEKFKRRAKGEGRTLTPWKDFSTAHLFERLLEEFQELIDAGDEKDTLSIMDEAMDVANFAWFIYEQAKAAHEAGA